MANSSGVIEISIVIPCLDEEEAVGAVVDMAWAGIAASGRPGEVIVVDNGSTDHSAAVARGHGAVVVHEPRRGYGSAYLAGLAAARGRYVVMGDADESYDLSDLAPFLELLDEGHDLVLGSRLRGTIHPGAMPWLHRRLGNPVLTGMLNLLFRARVSDAHCGLRAIRRASLPHLGLRSPGMEFASEMVLKAAKRGLRIAEVPIAYYPRTGRSKLNSIHDAWRHVRFMLVHSPSHLFLIPGLALAFLGLGSLLALAAGPAEVFGRRWQLHAMIAATTVTLVAAQIVQLGLFARTYAVLHLGERDALVERLWRRLKLEYGLLVGGLVLLAGIVVLGSIAAEWARVGFGEIERTHPALVGLTLVGLGVQTIFGSFFLSIIGLAGGAPAAEPEPDDQAELAAGVAAGLSPPG